MMAPTEYIHISILSKAKAHPTITLIALYLLLTAGYAFFGFLHNLDDRIRGADSVYYYVYLPSIIFDGDFDFANNLTPDVVLHYTKLGKVRNDFSIGPAILWSPFFLLGHLVTLIGRALGSTLSTDGNSSIYHTFVYLGNSLYGLAGLILTNRLLQQFVPIGAALLATTAIMLSSPITLYLWDFTAVAHNCSLFMGALFLLIWRRFGMQPLTALTGAMMILVRWEDGLLLLVPALAALAEIPEVVRQGKLRRWVVQALLFLVILVVGFSPQALAWKEMFGSYFLVPQGSEFLKFSDLPLFSFFFSTRHGLFLWHPILLLGLVGLLFLWRREKVFTVSLLAVFMLEVVVNAASSDWWGGWSFGQRRFINFLPVFALGIGLVIDRCGVGVRQRRVIYGLIIILAVWNLLFVNQFFLGTISHSSAITPREMIIEKFQPGFVMQKRKAGFSAMKAYSEGNLNVFRDLAAQAYALDHNDRPNRALFVISALLTYDQYQDATKAAEQWSNDEPEALLPRWALAEILVRQKMYDKAIALFPQSNGINDEERVVREKIETQADSTITPVFWRLLSDYLGSFYFN